MSELETLGTRGPALHGLPGGGWKGCRGGWEGRLCWHRGGLGSHSEDKRPLEVLSRAEDAWPSCRQDAVPHALSSQHLQLLLRKVPQVPSPRKCLRKFTNSSAVWESPYPLPPSWRFTRSFPSGRPREAPQGRNPLTAASQTTAQANPHRGPLS